MSNAQTTTQTPGHLFGPAAPHLAFFYGDDYLGETRGHPRDIKSVEAAQQRLLDSIDMLEPADRTARRFRLLRATHIKLYCGNIVVEYGPSRAKVAN